jgi:lysophospholipase-3
MHNLVNRSTPSSLPMMMTVSLARLFVVVIALPLSFSSPSLQPVVLLNGLAGSSLNARLNHTEEPHHYCDTKKSWYQIWLSPADLLPGVIDCFFHNIVLKFDPNTKTYRDTENVDIDGNVAWGTTKALAYLDPALKSFHYFSEIIEALENIGYVDGGSLVGAPYDWRLAPDGLDQKPTYSGVNTLPYFEKLKILIETTVAFNGGRKAHIISHSMGGPVALAFLHRQSTAWKDQYIASFIAISPPFGGSIKTVRAVLSGDNFDAPVVHENIFWPVQSTCASGPWLFPQPCLWDNDEKIITTPTASYGARDWMNLLGDMPSLKQAQQMTQSGNLLTDTLGEKEFVAPQVPVAILRGIGVETQIGYEYNVDFKNVNNYSSAPPPTKVFSNKGGDGTVPNRSLARALKWRNEQTQPITYSLYPGAGHMSILQNKYAIDHILECVQTNH